MAAEGLSAAFNRIKQMNIYLESLGCARNQVDSEIMLGRLVNNGWSITDTPENAHAIVVNTCSFVESAINESIDTILALAAYKKDGVCQRLIVAGCLPERFREAIVPELVEVDMFLGTGAFDKIVEAVETLPEDKKCLLPDPDRVSVLASKGRQISESHTAYVKIAEGCSRRCTYCIIPKLRGNQKSRPLDHIVTEAQELVDQGVKELTLVSQDTTRYGHDRSEGHRLETLLTALSRLSDDIWIRFMYGHPESITEGIIKTVAAHENVCPYFDLPIQHASETVLKKMGRHPSKKRLLQLFEQIRSIVPDAVIRTTLIVGFPGETEADFIELVNFIQQVRFDHLGVFTYSDAEDLPSHRLPGHVPPDIASSRRDILMKEQQAISEQALQKYVRQTVRVLVESKVEDTVYIARTAFQAPEVDGIVYLHTDGPQPDIGDFGFALITDALEYDLIGDLQ